MSHQARPALAGGVLGLALGLLALGPALGWGFVLLQDMVFVPEPAFSLFTFGLAGGAPRVVPSDAVVTALSRVLPGELVQKLILLAIFVLGASGAAVLVPSSALGPRLVAGACYVWNPYVAERLLIGQWALLLGYAGLPWVVYAVSRGRRLAVSLLPAATGGFAAMLVTIVTALPVAVFRRTPVRAGWESVLRTGLVLGAFCLPWLVAAAVRPHGLAGDPVGVEAFASRADTPFGAVGSLLSLGGIWNANAVPAGYEGVVGAVARLLLSVAGIAGFVWLGRRVPFRNGLLVAAVVGFGIGCAGVTEAGRSVLKWLVGVWGGFAVFRDAQQYVAPLALLVAVGVGLLTAAAVRALGGERDETPTTAAATATATAAEATAAGPWTGTTAAGRWAGTAASGRWAGTTAAGRWAGTAASGRWAGTAAGRWVAVLVVVPVAVLPTMAWGCWGALDAVAYPRSWYEAREVLRADPAPGEVLVLPFESYRRFAWNGHRAVLDPAQRFFAVPGRRVVTNDVVRVGELVVRSEDPRAAEVERVLAGGSPDLARLGFRYVVVDAGTDEERRRFADWLADAEVVVNSPELRLHRLEPPLTPR